MTKKDYKAFATILRTCRKDMCKPTCLEVIEDMICDYFKADNPLFDVKRFKKESK